MGLEVWAQELFRTLTPLKAELKLFVGNEDGAKNKQEEAENNTLGWSQARMDLG